MSAKKYPYKKGSKISSKEAKELYTLWLELGSYAAVRRAIGCARSESAIANHIKILLAEEKTTIIINK